MHLFGTLLLDLARLFPVTLLLILVFVVVVQWFINHMAEDDWWPIQILIKCPNQVVRQVSHLLLSSTPFIVSKHSI